LRRAAQVFALFLALGILAGCSTLPQSGPTRSGMLSADELHNRAIIAEVTPSVVNLLSATKPPSLVGAFGDYRPPRELRVGIGDSVEITIWESGQGGLFSSPVIDRASPGARTAVIPAQVVSQDGAITVPFAGRVPVVGKTPPEIEQTIVERLQGKALDPQALVTVTHNVSNTVTVMSELGPSSQVPLSVRGDRLLPVIAEAGGAHAPVVDTAVVLARGDHIVRVPMEAVLDDPREDIYLLPGDVVTLVHDPQTFTAVGATGRNAVVPFDLVHLSLEQALAKAGGLLDDRADATGVFVIRFETPSVASELPASKGVPVQARGVPTVYHLNMREAESLFLARSFPMRDNDIVYVSNSPLTDVQKVFTLINLLVTPVVTGVTIRDATP
jgi:polysaccharide export outer membrane protein